MSERTIFDEDVERMARERARIEEKLESRERELSKIGNFSKAYCTEFDHKDGRDWVDESVKFVFELPNGETESRSFSLENGTDSLQRFMDAHEADSVTDMVGTEHACVNTDDGWELWRSQSARPFFYYANVKEDGRVRLVPWFYHVLAIFTYGAFAIGLDYFWPDNAIFFITVFVTPLLVCTLISIHATYTYQS